MLKGEMQTILPRLLARLDDGISIRPHVWHLIVALPDLA
jgi:hypothetical protein